MRRVFFRPWSCTCVGAPLRRDEALKRCWIPSAVPDSRRHSALAVKDCPGITVGGNGTWACGTTDQASQQTCPVSESGMGPSPCARKRECSPPWERPGVLTMFHVKHGWSTTCRAGAISRRAPSCGDSGLEGVALNCATQPYFEALRTDGARCDARRRAGERCCEPPFFVALWSESLLFNPRHFTAADFVSLNCTRPHCTVWSVVFSFVLICALVI